jgi:shikimate kinase
MGSGKTSTGAALARLLRLPFMDSDAEIKKVFGLSSGAFIEKRGLSAFRRAEAAGVKKLAAGPAAVIALGGGLYPSPRRWGFFRKAGVTIWLKRPLAEMLRLAGAEGGRPLLLGRDPLRKARRLYLKRKRFYALCDLTVNAAGLTPLQAAGRINLILHSPRCWRDLEKRGFITA